MALREMMIASLFAALLAVSSQFSILIGPVPHTLQPLVVLLSSLILGGRWSFVSVAVWILLGVFGLPVFAQGKAGAAVLLGPTGGFLLGFALCAYLTGHLFERGDLTFKRVLFIMFIGLIVVYTIGILGFMVSFEYFLHKPMSWSQAFTLSVAPFFPFDLIKAIMAAYLGLKIHSALLRSGLRK